MTRLNAASAWTALLAMQLGTGCSSEGGGDTAGTSGGDPGGSGGGSSSTGNSMVASSSASGIGPSSSSGMGSGGGTAVCDPPAPPGSLYEKTAVSYDIDQVDPVSMCNYRDRVLLIVNVAAL